MIVFMKWLLFVCAFFCLFSCSDSGRQKSEEKDVSVKQTALPVFSADSAYAFVKAQCDFGSRVPGTEAHQNCMEFFLDKFSQFNADTVFVQKGTATLFDLKEMPLYNVVASYNIECDNRILICAHWDSRPYSDQDEDKDMFHKPIIGANDGASGVGVILELARLLSTNNAPVGVDFVLFDLEDWGAPEGEHSLLDDGGWALGSKYWMENIALPATTPEYGILLDMVGAPNATFYREYISDSYAPWIVDKIWGVAGKCGYSSTFVNKAGGAVTDDHINVSKAGIPCVDIIHYEMTSGHGFGYYWHTQKDDMRSISGNTLGIVGDVLVHMIFE